MLVTAVEVHAHDVLRRAFVDTPGPIVHRAERFGCNTCEETSAAVNAASQALRRTVHVALRLYSSCTHASAKRLDKCHEIAKQVSAGLLAYAEFCEAAVHSSDMGVVEAALAEARRARHFGATLALDNMRVGTHHVLVFDLHAAMSVGNLFGVVALDDSDGIGAGGGAVQSCGDVFPRGNHSFTLRMAPLNLKLLLDSSSNLEWSQCSSTRFPLTETDVTVEFTGDPNATWECTRVPEEDENDRFIVSYGVSRSSMAVVIKVNVLGVCVLQKSMVS